MRSKQEHNVRLIPGDLEYPPLNIIVLAVGSRVYVALQGNSRNIGCGDLDLWPGAHIAIYIKLKIKNHMPPLVSFQNLATKLRQGWPSRFQYREEHAEIEANAYGESRM
jgi:hypothetical protein